MIDYAGKAGKIRKIRINQDKSGKFGNNQIKSRIKGIASNW
jgi:hypothetical protein